MFTHKAFLKLKNRIQNVLRIREKLCGKKMFIGIERVSNKNCGYLVKIGVLLSDKCLGEGFKKSIFRSIYQYILKLKESFNIPQMQVLFHMFI